MREARVRHIHEIAAGSELAEAVTDSRGTRLYSTGTVLSERQLASLAARDIQTVTVWVTVDDAKLQAARTAAEEKLGHRFRHHRENGLMMELEKAVLSYRLGSLEQ